MKFAFIRYSLGSVQDAEFIPNDDDDDDESDVYDEQMWDTQADLACLMAVKEY
jgi:hypothetical protein